MPACYWEGETYVCQCRWGSRLPNCNKGLSSASRVRYRDVSHVEICRVRNPDVAPSHVPTPGGFPVFSGVLTGLAIITALVMASGLALLIVR